MNNSKYPKYLYSDFYDGVIHILIMCLPIILGTLNELLTNNMSVMPVSLTIAIVGEMYSVKDIWKDEIYSCSKRIKWEMFITMLLLTASLIYTAVIFTLSQVPEGIASVEIKNTVVADSNSNNFWNTYTVPTILYGLSVLPYLWEVGSVLIYEFKNCNSKSTKPSSELPIYPDFTGATIN